MNVKGKMSRVLFFCMAVCIMAGGAFGIYKLKYEYSLENLREACMESILSEVVTANSDTRYMFEQNKMDKTDGYTVFKPQANAGGEIITDEVNEKEQWDEVFLEETIAVKEQYNTVQNETTGITAYETMIAETTISESVCEEESASICKEESTMSIADIFRLMGYSSSPGGGGTAETTSIDINSITMPYELPYELPKPMG